jgi:aspartyl-tRNA(Asn)/glutamyl-tRNA(Gln) amidotransferase subunit A
VSLQARTAAFAPIADVGSALRGREFSVIELVEAALDHIAAAARLNACSVVLRERALRAAFARNAELQAGADRGPLHGIPFTVKDNFDLAGVTTRAGSTLLPQVPAMASAAALVALEEAGAVLVAKTNMYELAYGAPNPAFGAVLNPWGELRATGGSSSGAAVSVAAGLCYAALGGDSGGSIRIPAAYCGVVGFKPSADLVPTDGVVPVSATLDHVGPIGRTVEDVALVMEALVPGFGGLGSESVEDLRVGVLDASTYDSVQPAVKAALDVAEDGLRAGGAEVEEVAPPTFAEGHAVKWAISAVEAADTHRMLLEERRDQIEPPVRRLLEEGEEVSGTAYLAALRERRALRAALELELAGVDAVLMPAVETVAPALAANDVSGPDGSGALRSMTRFMSLLNVTGAPAVVVPFGVDPDGLPLSLQVVGRIGHDRTVLRAARAVKALATPLGRPPDAIRDV